jgi:hypothetical protein
MGYYNNYLVDNHSCIVVGVQATSARLSEESRAAEDMIARFAQWQGELNKSNSCSDTARSRRQSVILDLVRDLCMPGRDRARVWLVLSEVSLKRTFRKYGGSLPVCPSLNHDRGECAGSSCLCAP